MRARKSWPLLAMMLAFALPASAHASVLYSQLDRASTNAIASDEYSNSSSASLKVQALHQTGLSFEAKNALKLAERTYQDALKAADPTDLGNIGSNIAIVNTDNPKGYVFEMRIPWNIHHSSDAVEAGQRIRWHMYANNSRELPSNQDVAMSPSGRGNLNRIMASWNRAMLDPKP